MAQRVLVDWFRAIIFNIIVLLHILYEYPYTNSVILLYTNYSKYISSYSQC